jgi:SAM-dependent methyltransferase
MRALEARPSIPPRWDPPHPMKRDVQRPGAAELDEMLRINREQARFYDREAAPPPAPARATASEPSGASTAHLSPAARLWRYAKGKRHRVERLAGMGGLKDRLHHEWLDDPTGKRVLDLGCGRGHQFSFYMAERAERYLGVDLSGVAIDGLNRELQARGWAHAEGKVVDFLDPDFPEGDFDVVHARSVIHHFRYFDAFLRVLHQRMAPGGIVLTFDPLQTALSARLVRALYRPFQEDRDWEWPLTRQSFELIDRYFEIEQVQGLLGRAKWAIPLALLNDGLAEKA